MFYGIIFCAFYCLSLAVFMLSKIVRFYNSKHADNKAHTKQSSASFKRSATTKIPFILLFSLFSLSFLSK